MDTGTQAKTRGLAAPLSWPLPGRSLSHSPLALRLARWRADTADEVVSGFHGVFAAVDREQVNGVFLYQIVARVIAIYLFIDGSLALRNGLAE
jgi:hypothetical protein